MFSSSESRPSISRVAFFFRVSRIPLQDKKKNLPGSRLEARAAIPGSIGIIPRVTPRQKRAARKSRVHARYHLIVRHELLARTDQNRALGLGGRRLQPTRIDGDLRLLGAFDPPLNSIQSTIAHGVKSAHASSGGGRGAATPRGNDGLRQQPRKAGYILLDLTISAEGKKRPPPCPTPWQLPPRDDSLKNAAYSPRKPTSSMTTGQTRVRGDECAYRAWSSGLRGMERTRFDPTLRRQDQVRARVPQLLLQNPQALYRCRATLAEPVALAGTHGGWRLVQSLKTE